MRGGLMTPNLYYKDDWCRLYNNDCMEMMEKFNDKYFDMAFADPPYNVGVDYKGHDDKMDEEAYSKWCMEWWLQLVRIAKLILITPSRGKMKMWAEDLPFPTDIMIWHKSNACTHSPFKVFKFITWEPIYIYGSPEARPAHDYVQTAISVQPDVGDHPCPKPRKLLNRLIDMFTEPNALIFDPFLGSGTTMFSAKSLQRRCIGTEINESYCEIIKKRLGQEVLPLELGE
ncbi:MAG: hypothetical protein CMB80_09265 [Flammeovirgaceae bacterium]|nr:hypothetical protein [Flammeovirgaceae bacterium]